MVRWESEVEGVDDVILSVPRNCDSWVRMSPAAHYHKPPRFGQGPSIGFSLIPMFKLRPSSCAGDHD